ncbi:MAG: fumarylacetoacetate hydrolase family protein [Sneathiellaceae bacterium]
MKLLRYGPKGAEKPAMLDSNGTMRDLSGQIPDLGPEQLSEGALRQLAALDPAALPQVPEGSRIGACVAGTRTFLAIGLNYHDHAKEAGQPAPAEPILFMKGTGCIAGPDDDLPVPPGSTKLDWEVELGIVIGSTCRHVTPMQALDHVAGYCTVNDVSERAWQIERSGQWVKGKAYDGFGPVGPWLVTRDEIPDPQALDLFLDLNGERKQTGNSATMIFGVAEIVSYVSQFMTLQPADIITTGTPPGVGLGMKPPRFLVVGDELRLGVSGLGEQRQRIVASRR